MKEFKDKNYKLIMGISVTCLVLIIFASSYAYFKTKIINKTNPFSVKVGKVDLLIDTNQITIENAAPILDEDKNEKAVTKTFTIKRTSDSNLDICYNLYLVIDQITDNIKNSKYLKYELTDKKSGEVISKNLSTAAYSEGKSTILLKNQYLSDSDTSGVEYELKVWLSYDEVEDQTSLLGGSLTAHLYVSGMQGTTCPASVETLPALKDKLLADNPTIKTRTSFNTVFTETNTGTLYKATESIAGSAAKDVYYFAGDAKNNWVKFGKYQTDKVVYRGYYSATSSDYKEYLTMDACSTATSYNKNCTEYIYWNKGNDIYWRIIRTNHDGSIRLLYAGKSPDTTEGYIGTSSFNIADNSPKYVGYMYGDSDADLDKARTNTNNSTIKTYIDNWYSTNLSSYSKYISTEAVYCNDRQLDNGQSWTFATSPSKFMSYITYSRLDFKGDGANANPTYNCAVREDSFSASTTGGGNGKLTYPIALMTADEIAYAGGVRGQKAPTWYYLNSAGGSITGILNWWSLSPFSWNGTWSNVWRIFGYTSNFDFGDVNYGLNVRPAISLKTCTLWTSGNGAPETPYEIVENGGC